MTQFHYQLACAVQLVLLMVCFFWPDWGAGLMGLSAWYWFMRCRREYQQKLFTLSSMEELLAQNAQMRRERQRRDA